MWGSSSTARIGTSHAGLTHGVPASGSCYSPCPVHRCTGRQGQRLVPHASRIGPKKFFKPPSKPKHQQLDEDWLLEAVGKPDQPEQGASWQQQLTPSLLHTSGSSKGSPQMWARTFLLTRRQRYTAVEERRTAVLGSQWRRADMRLYMLLRARHGDVYAALWQEGPEQLKAAAAGLARAPLPGPTLVGNHSRPLQSSAFRMEPEHRAASGRPPAESRGDVTSEWVPAPRLRLPRQRGNVPFNDALPRPHTFFKLPRQWQRRVLGERLVALRAVLPALPPSSAARMYTAAPLMLSLPSRAVAIQLRALALVLRCSYASVACKVASQPSLGLLSVDGLAFSLARLVATWRLPVHEVAHCLAASAVLAAAQPSALLLAAENLSQVLQCSEQRAARVLLRCPQLAVRSVAQLQAAWESVQAVCSADPRRIAEHTPGKPAPASKPLSALELVDRLPSVLTAPSDLLPCLLTPLCESTGATREQAVQWLMAKPRLMSRTPFQVKQAVQALAGWHDTCLEGADRSLGGSESTTNSAWLLRTIAANPVALCVPAQALRVAAMACQQYLTTSAALVPRSAAARMCASPAGPTAGQHQSFWPSSGSLIAEPWVALLEQAPHLVVAVAQAAAAPTGRKTATQRSGSHKTSGPALGRTRSQSRSIQAWAAPRGWVRGRGRVRLRLDRAVRLLPSGRPVTQDEWLRAYPRARSLLHTLLAPASAEDSPQPSRKGVTTAHRATAAAVALLAIHTVKSKGP